MEKRAVRQDTDFTSSIYGHASEYDRWFSIRDEAESFGDSVS